MFFEGRLQGRARQRREAKGATELGVRRARGGEHGKRGGRTQWR